jgi:hypothetical protein
MTRGWRVLVVLAVIGAVSAGCSDDGPGEGEARLEVDGEATVERAGGGVDQIDGSTDIGRGDRVVMLEGDAIMRLQGGTTFELRAGLADAADTALVMDKVPVLEAGDLLVATPASSRVEADGTEVVVREGAARLSRAFGMSASAYDADLELDSAGVASEVPSLRQVAVPDLGRPRPPRPVVYDGTDPWDKRYLGAAMTYGEELETLAKGLTEQLPSNEGRTPGFFKLILPGLDDERSFTQELIDSVDRDRQRAQGDTLVGAAITDLGERGSFEERWGDVFAFRDDGAAWGIVALDQAVQTEPLWGTVEQAFNTSIEEVAQGPVDTPTPDAPTDADTPAGEGDQPPADDGGGTDTPDDGSPPPEEPTTPTLPPPLTPPPSGEPDPVLEPVVEPVTDLVDDLLGGLLG